MRQFIVVAIAAFMFVKVCKADPLPDPPPQNPGTIPTVQQQSQTQQANTSAVSATELSRLQIQFDKAINDNKAQLDKLQSQIESLKPKNGEDQATRITQLSSKINFLEQLNQQRLQNSRNLDQIRYETGKNILNVLIDKSATLKVATGLGTALSGFQTTLNPMNDQIFKTEISTLSQNLDKANKSILSNPVVSGLMANPYVSLVMSVVSVFVSDTKADKKLENMKNVICVADYSSKTTSDFQFIDNSIKNLDERVRAFNSATRIERFKNYAAVVNYNYDWDYYLNAINATGQDPIKSLTDTFFQALPTSTTSDSTPSGLRHLHYQVENVKRYVAEYEALIREINDFYDGFASIIKKDANMQLDNTTLCKDNPSIARVKTELTALLPTVELAKKDFEKAYLTSIPAESRRVLYTVN